MNDEKGMLERKPPSPSRKRFFKAQSIFPKNNCALVVTELLEEAEESVIPRKINGEDGKERDERLAKRRKKCTEERNRAKRATINLIAYWLDILEVCKAQ